MSRIAWEEEKPVYIYSLKKEIPPNLESKVIGRYFTLSGFLNMLETSELSFSKISNFEDKAEGVPQYSEMRQSLEQSEENVGTEYTQTRKKHIIETIDNYYASCWTMKEYESYLMWKNYSSFHEGVLVLSTVKQLINSTNTKSYEKYNENGSETEKCFFGEMDYCYDKELKSDHYKAFGKSQYFSDESEFRLVVYHHPIIIDNIIRRSIKDLTFINSVICSPGATKEFIDLIKKIVMNYSIQDSIVKESEMKKNTKEIFNSFISNK